MANYQFQKEEYVPHQAMMDMFIIDLFFDPKILDTRELNYKKIFQFKKKI